MHNNLMHNNLMFKWVFRSCLAAWYDLGNGELIIKCEGIIKAMFENPKANQNTCMQISQLLIFVATLHF